MICKCCRDEADNKLETKGECGVCGRAFATTVNGLLPRHKGAPVYVQVAEQLPVGTRYKCSGSGLAAMRGHALCKGPGWCDCHHRRKGYGRG